MRVALVHDYLREYGNAERVLQVLHRMYPEAPVYTAFVDPRGLGATIDRFAGWDIRTTWAHRLPAIAHHYNTYRFLLPYFWESLDLSAYDLVISSSGNYLSKAVLTRADTLHVCYCHTPPRYLWEPATHALPSWYTPWIDSQLRQYDFHVAQRCDRFVANSARVARRIKKFYRCTAEVIPPPVSIQGEGQAGNQYYLYVGPLTRDQHVDLAVAACTRSDRPLWIVGTGSDAQRLQALAGKSIRFLGAVPDQNLTELYAHAKALLFLNPDADFGFPPVEAMGRGVPVIASAQSGIQEIVLNYRTGLLFAEPTVESLCETLSQFEGLRFFSHACIQRAEEFAESVFVAKLEWFITQAFDDHPHHTHPSP
ncbi:glycosyltransferase [Leptothermofonsia sichuanensis E412]|uniref:glycosyltransferase n=1 Tax=Leptothermofonsia sichuanensis TaxID=2917832 RepID=UPI001CA61430|nr:glycosyltransferase [Leptothermofonsia sichuanensis]QZZ20177.1 glycosyltransferase [Leptothermofonsia sichuanensis E412]